MHSFELQMALEIIGWCKEKKSICCTALHKNKQNASSENAPSSQGGGVVRTKTEALQANPTEIMNETFLPAAINKIVELDAIVRERERIPQRFCIKPWPKGHGDNPTWSYLVEGLGTARFPRQ